MITIITDREQIAFDYGRMMARDTFSTKELLTELIIRGALKREVIYQKGNKKTIRVNGEYDCTANQTTRVR